MVLEVKLRAVIGAVIGARSGDMGVVWEATIG